MFPQSEGEILTDGMCWNVDRHTNRQCAGPIETENTISEDKHTHTCAHTQNIMFHKLTSTRPGEVITLISRV